MEWARAKGIILFLLLVFNIYLFVNIFGYVRGYGITDETIRNAENILKSRGIRLECTIPDYNSDTPKLVVDNKGPDRLILAGKLLGGGYSEDSLAGTYINGSKKLSFDSSDVLSYTDTDPSGTVDFSRKNAVEKYTRDFLIDKGLADSSYILDEKKVNGDGSIYLCYLEKYRDFFVYDNYIKVTVTKKGIAGIVAQRRHITGMSSFRVSDIAAAYQVLLANFDGAEGVTITGIDIGYKDNGIQDLDGIKSLEQLPAWRVKIGNAAAPKYFSTIDGKEIK